VKKRNETVSIRKEKKKNMVKELFYRERERRELERRVSAGLGRN